jgi:hypothetical protein
MNDTQFTGASADQKDPELLLDQEFPASLVGEGKVSFTPAFGFVEQPLTLLDPPQVSTLRQRERPVAVEEFKQGHDGDLVEEEFEISDLGKVDVMVVIDNSGSMADEQDKLKGKLPALTKHLATTDWQVAVVTTDNSCLAGGKVVKRGDATAEADFAKAIESGTGGSADEKGIKQALLALAGQCSTGNYMWLRPDASVAILFVTDENNTCTVVGSEPCEAGNRPAELIAALKNLRADRARAYGLTWKRGEPGCSDFNGESTGTRYEEVITGTGGFRGSICADDYTAALEKVSRDVARAVKYEFDLNNMPDGSGVMVSIDGADYKDYELKGNKIKLKNIRGEEIKLKVSYRFGAVAKNDRFPLAGRAAGGIQAWVDGQSVSSAKLTYDESTQELVFVDMPPDNATIKIKYRKDEALETGFDLGGLAMPNGPEKIEIDGEPAAGFSYDATTHVLSFPEAPLDGAEIKVSWHGEGSKVTRYELTGYDPETLKGVSVRDEESSELIDASFEDGVLILPEEEVEDGRKVVVSYGYGDASDVLSHELPVDPLPGTVEVSAPEAGEDCIGKLSVEGRKVSFSCDGDELGRVEVSYRYVAERYTEFVLGPLPTDAKLHFQVFVNGAAISQFQREGNVIRIPAELLGVDAKVRVVVTKVYN